MIEKLRKYFEESDTTTEFAEFILRPFKEGKQYHIGGISELMDITMGMDTEDIEEFICERNIQVPEDIFTVHYDVDMDGDGLAKNPNDCSVIVSVQKISPNYILVVGWLRAVKDYALCPSFCIIPTGDSELDIYHEDFMEQLCEDLRKEGVEENFVEYLEELLEVTIEGSTYFFFFDSDDRDTTTDEELDGFIEQMKNMFIDVLCRFLIIKRQGSETKVTANMKPFKKGYIKLPNATGDYYLIKSPNGREFLGYTRRTPEV